MFVLLPNAPANREYFYKILPRVMTALANKNEVYKYVVLARGNRIVSCYAQVFLIVYYDPCANALFKI